MPYIRLLLDEVSSAALAQWVHTFRARGLLCQLDYEAGLGGRPFHITVVRDLRSTPESIQEVREAITTISENVSPFSLSRPVVSKMPGCLEFLDASALAFREDAANAAKRFLTNGKYNDSPVYIRIGAILPTCDWAIMREEMGRSLDTIPPLRIAAVEFESASGSQNTNAPMLHTLLSSKHVFSQIHGGDCVAGAATVARSSEDTTGCIFRFFCLSDFGKPNGISSDPLAACMDAYARLTGPPDIILALGDNFYQDDFVEGSYDGVGSVSDRKWTTDWVEPYIERYSSLRVPWKVVLGNHDYPSKSSPKKTDPQAQIDFSLAEGNPVLQPQQRCLFQTFLRNGTEYTKKEVELERTWQMPAKNYSFTILDGRVEFFALDAKSIKPQTQAERDDPANQELFQDIQNLKKELEQSRASWKIVFGHYPIYTAGRHHGLQGRELGFRLGLEEVLVTGGACAYLTGHEHAMQYHKARGVHHFIAGSACEYTFYAGRDPDCHLTWIDESKAKGFLAAEVYVDKLVFRFVAFEDFPSPDSMGFKIVRTWTVDS
jgi:tartrate-resistant acid phosphatase type 5